MVGDDSATASPAFHQGRLRQAGGVVVAALDPDVRAELGKAGLRGVFLEHHYGVDGAEGLQQFLAVRLVQDGTLRALEPAGRGIGIQADDEAVTKLRGGSECPGVAGVQEIEAASGRHHGSTAGLDAAGEADRISGSRPARFRMRPARPRTMTAEDFDAAAAKEGRRVPDRQGGRVLDPVPACPVQRQGCGEPVAGAAGVGDVHAGGGNALTRHPGHSQLRPDFAEGHQDRFGTPALAKDPGEGRRAFGAGPRGAVQPDRCGQEAAGLCQVGRHDVGPGNRRGPLGVRGGPDAAPWPTPIAWVDGLDGIDTKVGGTLCAKAPADNPMRIVYEELFGCGPVGDGNWDAPALLFALGDVPQAFSVLGRGGAAVINEQGGLSWQENSPRRHDFYVHVVDQQALNRRIEQLLMLERA